MNEYVKELANLRALVVEQRRNLVSSALQSAVTERGTAYERQRGPYPEKAEKLLELQLRIEAIDRAIADEEAFDKPGYTLGNVS